MTDGPKMDWTRDNKQYDHFIQWQKRCKMIFRSTLVDQTDQIKGEYLKYWMGTEGSHSLKNGKTQASSLMREMLLHRRTSIHTGPSWKMSSNQRPTR